MGLFDKVATDRLLEKAMEHIDMDAIAREVMSRLVLKDLELYLVVRKFEDSETADFVGVTYSEDAAATLAFENGAGSHYPCTILQIDMSKLADVAVKAGVAREIYSKAALGL